MPVVIMGETGCGKTYSITYLATMLAMPFFQVPPMPFHQVPPA